MLQSLFKERETEERLGNEQFSVRYSYKLQIIETLFEYTRYQSKLGALGCFENGMSLN